VGNPDTPSPAVSPRPPTAARENIWLALACNAAYPALVLSLLSDEDRLGPTWSLIAALIVPLGYGGRDYWINRRWNIFSLLGVVSTVLTGGFGLLKLSGFAFAVKEAAVPLVLGLAVPFSLKMKQPLVRLLLFNDQILDTKRIEAALDERQQRPAFDRLLKQASWIVASSFFLSAVLNFVLAIVILKSTPGTPDFNRELGRLTALSYPIIMLPCMVILMFSIWKLLTGVEKLTGLDGEDLFHPKKPKGAKEPKSPPPTGEK
jgi:hypothetical protein